MAFIVHTEPDANIPSKNQEPQLETPNISCTGEYKKIPKKNPHHTDAHIIHLIISLTNIKNPRKGKFGVFDALLMEFLGPLKILP
jgi:hypothetical protein